MTRKLRTRRLSRSRWSAWKFCSSSELSPKPERLAESHSDPEVSTNGGLQSYSLSFTVARGSGVLGGNTGLPEDATEAEAGEATREAVALLGVDDLDGVTGTEPDDSYLAIGGGLLHGGLDSEDRTLLPWFTGGLLSDSRTGGEEGGGMETFPAGGTGGRALAVGP